MIKEIVSKINDTKEEITTEQYEVMRNYLKREFSDEYIDESTDGDVLELYLKQSIADMTQEENYYYFGGDVTDLYLTVKALHRVYNGY